MSTLFAGRVTGKNTVEQPGTSVDTDSVGKENTSGNKVELPKLSVERQQMKKKKKNAGFNLRKSLAWDRAFSTDEGDCLWHSLPFVVRFSSPVCLKRS